MAWQEQELVNQQGSGNQFFGAQWILQYFTVPHPFLQESTGMRLE